MDWLRGNRQVPNRHQRGSGILELLGNAELSRAVSAFAALTLSEWAAITALSIYAYRVGGPLAVGLVGFRFVPGAVSSALLAPLVEHARGVLARIAATRTLLLCLAAAAVADKVAFGFVVLIVAVDAVVAAPYRPAQARLLPGLAHTPEQLSASAAGVSIAKTLSQALGAVAAGLAVALIGPGAAVASAAAVMAFAGTLTRGLGRPAGSGTGWSSLRVGINAIPGVLRHREASPLVLASALRTLTRGLWTALLVVVALRTLRLGAAGVGGLNGAVGIGALAGAAITVSLIGRSRLWGPCALSFIAAGLTVSVVAGVSVVALVAILAALWGASMAVSDATSLSLLHRLLDSNTLSRTIGVMEALKLGMEGAGALLAPALVALFGVRTALALAGVPLPLVVALSVPRLKRADDLAVDRGRVVSLLHRARAFRSLDMASLEGLAAGQRSLSVAAGEDIVREGEPGDEFYLIESGEAEVLVGGLATGRLGPGAGFGERALLRGAVRSATVRAVTPLELHAIGRSAFLSALTGEPVAEFEMGAQVDHPGARQISTGTGDPLGWLAEVLAEQGPFAGLDREALDRVARSALLENWLKGDELITQGAAGDALFVVLSGRACAVRDGVRVAEFEAGDCFGELAVLYDVPRKATVLALESLAAYRIQADVVRAARAAAAEGGAVS